MSKNIAIIKLKIGNYNSISKCLNKLNIKHIVTDDNSLIYQAEKIILPGVGAFGPFFKEIYDNELFRLLSIYPNVETLLERLVKNEIPIYIGTNKRFMPTKKILNFLSWDKLFKKVYAIDKFEKNFIDKTQMLEKLLEIENISPKETLYIGDKFSDFISASNNKISFIGANWGDSDFESFNKELMILNKLDKQNINFLVSLFKI